MPSDVRLATYLRGFPIPRAAPKPPRRASGPPRFVLVLDVETTTDTEQRLLFGGYQFCRRLKNGTLRVLEHGVFFDEGPGALSSAQSQVIRDWVAGRMDASAGVGPTYCIRSRAEFVHDILLHAAGKLGALVVGLNLAFDLARLADEFRVARGRAMSGGYSLVLPPHPGIHRPGSGIHERRLRLKVIGERRAFYAISATGFKWGRFLDLRTLLAALTDESFTLDGAAEYYRLDCRKPGHVTHGRVTPAYLDYHANDLDMTRQVCERACADLAAHPIQLDPDKAFSSASIGKHYLQAMHIRPPLGRLLPLDHPIHGIAMAAYFGGRAECHIRRVTLPILLVDFRSQYPTMNLLLNLWPLLTAQRVRMEDCTTATRAVLAQVTAERLFDRAAWPDLGFFALILPSRDLLPTRARYAGPKSAPGIGLNSLTDTRPHWVAGPDLAASVLLTGKQPHILQAVRLVVEEAANDLRPVKFRGKIPLDPSRPDFIATLVEERERLKYVAGAEPLRQGLKLLANATTYGVGVQFDPRVPLKKEKPGRVLLGTEEDVLPAGMAEDAGRYCLPYPSALTTAGARLQLALLEHEVTRRGGTWAFADTDSMAIVAQPEPATLQRSGEQLVALARAEVEEIVARFATLNPFGGPLAGASILKIELDEPEQQNYVLAISAKRYAIFRFGADDRILIVKPSDHGLGHLFPPVKRDEWLRELWTYAIESALGRNPNVPSWWNAPALMRLTVTQPSLVPDQAFVQKHLRPMSFVLTPILDVGGHPGAIPGDVRLVCPFMDPVPPLHRVRWRDLRTGELWAATTTGEPGPGLARIKSLGQVVLEYLQKPEAKSGGRNGERCTRSSIGTLHRLQVHGAGVVYTGKEVSGRALSVEDPDGGDAAVFGERDEGGLGDVREALQRLSSLKAFAQQSGIPLRTLRGLKNARTRPRKTTVERVWRALRNF